MLAISIGLLLCTFPANADFISAQLSVNGLTCPFCAFGIEKKLLDVPGVVDVEVFLDEGRIALTFERGSKATVHDLEQAVHKAGFELAGLSLEASGAIQRSDEERILWIVHSGMKFGLVEDVEGRKREVSAETLRRLQVANASNGSSFVIVGDVVERDSREPLLVIREIKSGPGTMN